MGDRSKTSGVPRHEKQVHRHHCPAPGGPLNAEEAAAEADTTSFPRHTLEFLIEAIKRLRDNGPPECDK
jgi:hypothetical protein